MRYNHINALGRDASVLGFGCASLGSRIGARAGTRAVQLALDRGINWFDVAPPYGDGEAERHLGLALGKRRADAIICTKFGLARPRISAAKRLLRPLAQRALSLYPQLRSKISAARPHSARQPVEAAAVGRWLDESLHRLGTDYVDVFALHDPTAAELADDALFEALATLKRRGVIRAVSVAGSIEATELAHRYQRNMDFVQFADSPYVDGANRLAQIDDDGRLAWVSHGVFGSGTLDRFLNEPDEMQQRLGTLIRLPADGVHSTPSDLLLRYALSSNPRGVVITSMFDPEHLEANCLIANESPDLQLAPAVRRLIGGAPGK